MPPFRGETPTGAPYFSSQVAASSVRRDVTAAVPKNLDLLDGHQTDVPQISEGVREQTRGVLLIHDLDNHREIDFQVEGLMRVDTGRFPETDATTQDSRPREPRCTGPANDGGVEALRSGKSFLVSVNAK